LQFQDALPSPQLIAPLLNVGSSSQDTLSIDGHENETLKRARFVSRKESVERDPQASSFRPLFSQGPTVSTLGSHTQLVRLEKFPYSADA
jgi:hypothetical protein